MIEALTDIPTNVIAFACEGRVTSRDYETVLVPAVESGLKQNDKLRLCYQIGPDFSGIDLGAMWEDFEVGTRHLLWWERIAVITDVDWIRRMLGAFNFVMPRLHPEYGLAFDRCWVTPNSPSTKSSPPDFRCRLINSRHCHRAAKGENAPVFGGFEI